MSLDSLKASSAAYFKLLMQWLCSFYKHKFQQSKRMAKEHLEAQYRAGWIQVVCGLWYTGSDKSSKLKIKSWHRKWSDLCKARSLLCSAMSLSITTQSHYCWQQRHVWRLSGLDDVQLPRQLMTTWWQPLRRLTTTANSVSSLSSKVEYELSVLSFMFHSGHIIWIKGLSRQSTALVLTTNNRETKFHMHLTHRQAQNYYNLGLVAFYGIWPGNEAGTLATQVTVNSSQLNSLELVRVGISVRFKARDSVMVRV